MGGYWLTSIWVYECELLALEVDSMFAKEYTVIVPAVDPALAVTCSIICITTLIYVLLFLLFLEFLFRTSSPWRGSASPRTALSDYSIHCPASMYKCGKKKRT